MKKIILLITFPFILNSQNVTEAPSQIKDSIAQKKQSNITRSKDEAQQLAESLLLRIKNGEDMAKLATEFSDDPGSASKGGQLPACKKGQFVPEFEEALYKLKVGEISEVFETKYGFHFVQAIAREGDKIISRHILISLK